MANSLNKVMLIGHLGDDVKMHYFEKGNCLARFPLATNETFTNKQTGEKTTNTEWHNIVVRNKLAELCEKYLSKGDRIYVECRIKTRSYDQDGLKKYATEIHAADLTFLTTKKELSNTSGSMGSQAAASPTETHSEIQMPEPLDDDLPF